MKEIDDNLLTEFLEGTLDEPAAREIEAWYDASPANRHRLEMLYFVLFTADRLEAASKADSRAAFEQLRRRIAPARRTFPKRWLLKAARYAAVLAVCLFAAGTYVYRHRQDDRMCTVLAQNSDCTVTLPDGSTVRLARRSQLDYRASFGDDDRTVRLLGEAFFDIRKRDGKTFTVTTAHDARVVVRGTQFNLKAYDDSSDIETTLVEGAVDFHAADQIMALRPGQKASYSPSDKNLTLQTVNIENELSARLRTFRHVALSQIATVIRDCYGCDIAFRHSSLEEIRFTGTLDFDMPLEHILEVVTLSTNTRFTRTGEKIVIHKQ